MTPTESTPDNTIYPAIETRYSPDRREWNLLIRRPFYMNLRLGFTQNALWFGKNTTQVFNWIKEEGTT